MSESTDQSHPLGPLQETMLLHHLTQAAPGDDILQVVVRLRGPVDAARMEAAWQGVTGRYAALRSGFRWDGEGTPLLEVLPRLRAPFTWENWTGQTGEEMATRLEALAATERRRGFALDAPPLFRVAWLQLAPETSRLIWTFHQICLDEPSAARVLTEALEEYCLGQSRAAPPRTLRPGHREFISGSASRTPATEAFWREQLKQANRADVVTRLQGLPEAADPGWTRLELELPARVAAGLLELLAAERLPLETLAEGSWAVLLARYLRDSEMLLGVVRALRSAGFEEAIGNYTNIVPRRVTVRPDAEVAEWLRELGQAETQLAPHLQVSLSTLARWAGLQPGERLLNSLVRVDLGALAQVGGKASLADLVDGPLEVLEQPAVPLVAGLQLAAAGRLSLLYERRRVPAPAAHRLLEQWQQLLVGIVTLPQPRLRELSLLSSQQRCQIVQEWNATTAPYPAAACVHDLFQAQAEKTPEAAAVVVGPESLTYRELDRQASVLARRLQSLGVGADSRVALCLERSLLMTVAVLGVLKAGGAYVPLDPAYPAERLAWMLEDSTAQAVLTQASLVSTLPAVRAPVICLDAPQPSVETAPPGAPARPSPDSLAYVLYTSGSTGKPKGVAMAHRALVNLLEWQRRASSALPPGARTLQFASLSFDVSFQEMFSAWCSGGTLVLIRQELRQDPGALWRFCLEQGIHRLFVPFVALQQLAEAAVASPARPTVLREVITAGEQLQITPQIRALFHRAPALRLHNHYGPTETHVVTAYALREEVEAWPALPPIGKPIANARLYVLDPSLEPCPIGLEGEIWIGGDCLARGYLGRPDLTAERFVADHFSGQAGGRLYRTGDLGRYLPDGNLEFLGRTDDQVKIRGYRVELGEVESVLRGHPAVRECALQVFGQGAERRLAAFIVAHQGPRPSTRELRGFLGQRLPDYMVPSFYVYLDRLPLTPSGKVHRRALPEPKSEPAASAGQYVPPQPGLESTVAQVWARVLKLDRVSARDSFFDLGGTSLLLVQVHRQLETILGRPFPITVLFQQATVAGLAQCLIASQAPAPGPLDTVRERAARQREALARRRPPMTHKPH